MIPVLNGETMTSNSRYACFGMLVAACFAASAAFSQATYPDKSIKLIATVQPGGGVDLVAR